MLYTKDGKIKDGSRIVIVKDGYQTINPTREMILADGWSDYVAPTPTEGGETEPAQSLDEQLQDLLLEQYNNRTDISDADALKRPLLVYDWSTYVGKALTTGQIVSYEDKLYRVRQDVTSLLDTWTPGTSTAAIFEVIEVSATGAADDPIAYTPPMEIYSGKYYTQGGMTYLCTRDSGTALSHDLSALVGLYVSTV